MRITGISVHKAGGWIERKHGKKRRIVKLHFAVNTVTHEVVAMEISTDDMHDVKALPGLVEGTGRNVRVARVLGDGAYDSGKVVWLHGESGDRGDDQASEEQPARYAVSGEEAGCGSGQGAWVRCLGEAHGL